MDSLGNVYVAGETTSADFPWTAGAYDTSPGGASDGFVVKLAPDGSILAATFFGGTSTDYIYSIALDSAANVYLTGKTFSDDFPTEGAYDPSYAGSGGGGPDAFVAKLDSNLSSLDYSTYLGGSHMDAGYSIAVDSRTSDCLAGCAYVTGPTVSTDFSTTPGAFDRTQNRNTDAFIAKFNATGGLVYSTFLGGGNTDVGRGIAVDADGNAYVTGNTESNNFPTTSGAFDRTFNKQDAFVAKLNAAGSALEFSTFLGGSDKDGAWDIALLDLPSVPGIVDAIYVGGSTRSTNFPTTSAAHDSAPNGNHDAYVAILNANGSGPLVNSTYLGGSAFDDGRALALDAAGNAYVAGVTHSTNFPTTTGAYDIGHNGGADAFVAKLSYGSSLSAATAATATTGGGGAGKRLALPTTVGVATTSLTTASASQLVDATASQTTSVSSSSATQGPPTAIGGTADAGTRLYAPLLPAPLSVVTASAQAAHQSAPASPDPNPVDQALAEFDANPPDDALLSDLASALAG